MTNLSRSFILGCSVLALAACGPEEIVSPGTGGDINIGEIDNSVTNPGTGGGGTPTPTGVTPAADCPTIGNDQLSNNGTITGPTGTWRVCAFPQVFTSDATIPQLPGVIYALAGQTNVGVDDGPTADNSDSITGTTVELTIEPGVIVYGATPRSALVVQRGSQLNAAGEEDTPIIFTSRDNVTGLVTNNSSQQWGGIVLLGRARVSDCANVGANPTNPELNCAQNLEGVSAPIPYGGDTADDDSGTLAYVQIRYSGFVIGQDSELQSLTAGGIGNETTIDFVQSYNSSDDGVELFGGEPKMSHFIVVGAEDDSFDIDTGAKADIQYAIAVQRPNTGDSLLELDSPDGDFDFTALPRTNAQFTNFTFIARDGSSQALRVRGQADLNMSNGIVVKNGNCLRIDEEGAAGGNPDDESGPPAFNSVLFDCDTTTVAPFLETGNDDSYDASTLTNVFVNSATEDGYTPVFDATGLSTFFEASTFVGAVSAGDNWTTGWTCDSATVDFGSNSSCQSLPVFN